MSNDTTLGPIHPGDPDTIELDVWRYVLNAEGEKTGTIRRVGGRPVGDVLADLSYEARDLLKDVEYFSLDYCFARDMNTGVQDMTAEVPETGRIACYAVTGSNEGDYVHVDLHSSKGERTAFLLVKTFMGNDHAWEIARRFAKLLGA